MRTLRLISLPLLAILALAGCFDQPGESLNSPAGPAVTLQSRTADNGFMPIAPGNHWRYDWTFTTQIIPEGGAPEPPSTERGTIDIEHIEYRSIGEREYVLEREVFDGEAVGERLLRQDRAGYYIFERPKDNGKTAGRPMLSSALRIRAEQIAARTGADPTSVEAHFARIDAIRRVLRGLDGPPDASPPGGPFQEEIQTLAYPLHVGATWVIRNAPLFLATVEAHEQFGGVSAWRVRIDSELLDDDDFIRVWYSRCGELGRRVHAATAYVSTGGVPLGTLLSDEYVDIADADVDRGGCDVMPAGGGNDRGGRGSGVRSYPLAVGNRWTYDVIATQHPADGPPVVTTNIIDDVQEAWVELEGREYMRQVARSRDMSLQNVQHYRQDRDGLYVGPTIVVGSPTANVMPLLTAQLPRPARGPGENELLLIAYPLRVGASWKVVSLGASQVTATVEGRETLALPAGNFDTFRVRIDNPFQNPGDEATFWFSREGLVKMYQRAATGNGGWFEESRELLELDVVN